MTSTQPTAPEENSYYTVSQAAARLGVSRVSIWRWIRDGFLPATRLGPRTTRIKREDIDRTLVQIKTSGSRSWAVRSGAAAMAAIDGSSGIPPLLSAEQQVPDHAVQFYESDAVLVDTVVEFIDSGLRSGHAGIVVATRAHRHGVEARLRASGLDLDTAIADGQYVALDAADTLSRIMVAGTPDAQRFAETIGSILSRAKKNCRPVRIFGEMVALLAADRNYTAAVRLEMLWNDLQHNSHFSLLCAYPIGQLGADGLANVLGDVCSAHDRVIPAESYSQLVGEDDRFRAIVTLQQKVHWLQAQVEERKRVEDGLRMALAAEQDARQEAIIAQRKRDELFSIAAQELKHPIYSLSLQAQHALFRLGRETNLEPAQVEKAVEAVTGQPTEIPRLIGQLVNFSQLEARKLTLQPRWTDLPGLVETVVSEMRTLRPQHAIAVSAPDSLEIWIDPQRAKHVLECLIDNAIKYSPGGSPIDITLSEAMSGSVEVAVRDRGVGISPEKRDALFERCQETDESDVDPGLKLGLYVSRQIVELHGGELYAEFPQDGGTRFVMRLPAGREESTDWIAAD